MATKVEGNIQVLVSIGKGSPYVDKQIIADIQNLSKEIEKARGYLNTKVVLEATVTGVLEAQQLNAALKSMSSIINRNFNARLGTLAKNLNAAFTNLDPTKVQEFATAISGLAGALGQVNISQIARNMTGLILAFSKSATDVQNFISSLGALGTAILGLEPKLMAINAQLGGLANAAQTLAAASKVLGATTGATPAQSGSTAKQISAEEKGISRLINKYEKYQQILVESGKRLKTLLTLSEQQPLTPGEEKLLAKEALSVERAFNAVDSTAKKLNNSLGKVQGTQSVSNATFAQASNTLADYRTRLAGYQVLADKSAQATITLGNSAAKANGHLKDQYDTIGGTIKRQVQFLAGAAVLGMTIKFLGDSWRSMVEVLSEVNRVLTVSRSNFITLSQTAVMLKTTINDTVTKTGQSIRDVSTILKEFGSAGLTTEQSIAALKPTLDNVIATDSSVIETTRLVASVFNILGNTVTGSTNQLKNFTRVNDIFARATIESSTELDQLVQALKFSLPAAKEAGLDLEELTGIMSNLADQGLRGGNAGRAFRAALQQISKDAKGFQKAFRSVGIEIKIDPNKMLDVLDILNQIGEQIRGKDLDVEELGVFFKEFGLRGADAMLMVAKQIDKTNRQIKDLKENSKDFASATAQLKLDAPERQLAIFGENIKLFSREVFGPFIGSILAIIETVNKLSESFKGIDNWFTNFIITIVKVATFLGTLHLIIGIIASQLIKIKAITAIAGASASNYGTILATLSLIGSKLVLGFKVLARVIVALTMTMVGASTGAKALSAALTALKVSIGPAGIALAITTAAIIAFVGAVGLMSDSIKDIDDKLARMSQEIAEQRKFVNTYEDLAKKVEGLDKQFEEGVITQQQYTNSLKEIADSSDQAAAIISSSGGDASRAKIGFLDLAAANRELTKSLIDLNVELEKQKLDKLEGDTENIAKKYADAIKEQEKMKQKYKDIVKEFTIANKELIKRQQEVPSGGSAFEALGNQIKSNTKLIQNSRKAYATFSSESIKAFREHRLSLVQLTFSGNEFIRNTAKEKLKELDELAGGLHSTGDSVKAVSDLWKLTTDKINSMDFNKATFNIKDFKETLSGLEGLSADLSINLGIVVPDDKLESFKQSLIDAAKDTKIADNLITDENIETMSNRFQEMLGQINLPKEFQPSVDEVLNVLKKTETQMRGINDPLMEGLYLEQNLKDLVTEKLVMLEKIKATSDNISQSEGDILDANGKIVMKAIDLAALYESVDQTEDSILMTLTDETKEAEFYNKILQETNTRIQQKNILLYISEELQKRALDVGTDQLATAEYELKLAKKNYADKVKNSKAAEAMKNFMEGNVDAQKIYIEEEAKKAKALHEKLMADLKLFDITQSITKELKNARIEFASQRKNILFQTDQYKKTNSLLQERRKLLQQKEDRGGYTEKVLEAERLQIGVEQLVNDKARLNLLIDSVIQLRQAREEYIESLSVDNQRLIIAHQEQRAKEKIAELEAKRDSFEKAIADTDEESLKNQQDLLKAHTSLNNAKKSGLALDDKEVEKTIKILDLQKEIVSQYVSMYESAMKDIETPLTGALEKFLSGNQFTALARLGNIANTNAMDLSYAWGDTNEQVSIFYKALKDGNYDLTDLPKPIQEGARAWISLRDSLKQYYDLQNQMSTSKAAIFKAQFDAALELPGGIDKATDALNNYLSTIQYVDEEGKADNARQIEQMKIATGMQEKITKLHEEQKEIEPIDQNVMKEANTVLERTDKILKSMTESIEKLADAKFDWKGKLEELIATLQINPVIDIKVEYAKLKVASAPDLPGNKTGGYIAGRGSGDIIPAMLEPGEYVIPKDIVREYGIAYFNNLIGKNAQGFATGGGAGSTSRAVSSGGISVEGITDDPLLDYIVSSGIVRNIQLIQGDVSVLFRVISESFTSFETKFSTMITKLELIALGTNENYKIAHDNAVNDRNAIAAIKYREESLREENKTQAENFRLALESIKVIASTVNKFYKEPDNTEVSHKAYGGFVPGSGRGDIVPAMLEPGEYVIPKNVVDILGIPFFNELISRKYKLGGPVLGFGPKSPREIGTFGGIDQKALENFTKALNNFTDKIEKINKDKGTKDVPLEKKPFRLAEATLSGKAEAKPVIEDIDNITKGLNAFIALTNGDDAMTIGAMFEKMSEAVDKTDTEFKHTNVNFAKFMKNLNYFSKSAASRFIDRILDIGDTMRQVFTEDIPGYLSSFVSEVVIANTDILANFQQQREDIDKEYKNQKADLIEQLKRNEISYYDFFDQLEDLKKDNTDKELELERDKDQAMQEQMQNTLVSIADMMGDMIKQMVTDLTDFIGGIPALISPMVDAFGAVGSAIGGIFNSIFSSISEVINSIGDVIGEMFGSMGSQISDLLGGVGSTIGSALGSVGAAIGGLVGPVTAFIGSLAGPIGTAVGAIGGLLPGLIGSIVGFGAKAVSEIFGAAVQGLTPLIGFVTKLVTMTQKEFDGFINTIATLPEELDKLLFGVRDNLGNLITDELGNVINEGLVSRIPKIAQAFQDNFQKIGNKFAEVIETVFPLIADAFPKIIISAMTAMVPVVIAVLAQIPKFFMALVTTLSGEVVFFFEFFRQGFLRLTEFLIRDLPEIGTIVVNGITSALVALMNSTEMESALSELPVKIVDNLGVVIESIKKGLSTVGPIIVGIIGQSIHQLATNTEYIQGITGIAKSLLEIIVKTLSNLGSTLKDNFMSFMGTLRQIIVTELPTIITNTITIIGNLIQNMLPPLFAVAVTMAASVVSPAFIKSMIEGITKAVPEIIQAFIDVFSVANVTMVVDAFIQAFANAFSDQTFGDMLGVISPVTNMFNRLSISIERVQPVLDVLTNIVVLLASAYGVFDSLNVALGTINRIDFVGVFVRTLQLLVNVIAPVVAIFLPIIDLFSQLYVQINILLFPLTFFIQQMTNLAETLSTIGFIGIISSMFVNMVIALDGLKIVGNLVIGVFNTIKDSFISFKPQFDDLIIKVQDLVLSFSELVGQGLNLVAEGIGSLLGVMTLFMTDNYFVEQSLKVLNRVLMSLRKILDKLIAKTISSLLRVFNRISKLFERLSSVMDKLIFSNTKFIALMEKVEELLAPLVDLLMPGLEAVLTGLVLVLAGPLLVGLVVLVAALEGLIVVLDMINGVLSIFAPVIEFLQKKFAFLLPVIEILGGVLEKIVPIIAALGFVFFALTGPFGPLLILLGSITVALWIASESFKFFNEKVSGLKIFIQKVGKALKPLVDFLLPGFKVALDSIKIVLKFISNAVTTTFAFNLKIIKTVLTSISNLLGLWANFIKEKFEGIVMAFQPWIDIINQVSAVITAFIQLQISNWMIILEPIITKLSEIVEKFQEAIDYIQGRIIALKEFLTRPLEDVAVAIAAVTVAILILLSPLGPLIIFIGMVSAALWLMNNRTEILNANVNFVKDAIGFFIEKIERLRDIIDKVHQDLGGESGLTQNLWSLHDALTNANTQVPILRDAFISFIEGVKNAVEGTGGEVGAAVSGAANQAGLPTPEEVAAALGIPTKHSGGLIPHFAGGGRVKNPGKDNVFALLQSGEYVMSAGAVDAMGVDTMESINNGDFSTGQGIHMAPRAARDMPEITTATPGTTRISADAQAIIDSIDRLGYTLGSGGIAANGQNPSGTNATTSGGTDNMNTIDYYLKNFYNDAGIGGPGVAFKGGGISPRGFETNVTGPDSGTSRGRSQDRGAIWTDRAGSPEQVGSEAGYMNPAQSGGELPIQVTIDLSGASFSGDNIAAEIEGKLVEGIKNSQGELARVLREIPEKTRR